MSFTTLVTTTVTGSAAVVAVDMVVVSATVVSTAAVVDGWPPLELPVPLNVPSAPAATVPLARIKVAAAAVANAFLWST